MLTIRYENTFKRIKKRGYDTELLVKVIKVLANKEKLPEKYKDHNLTGNYRTFRECHIAPDWLLIYKVTEDELILTLTRTGTHRDLFG